MEYFPAPLEKLVEQFARLPGIGGKSAQRLAFHVLGLPEEEAREFAEAILDAKRSVTCCPECQNFTAGGLCPICASPKRDGSVICVVADPRDVAAIERSREFNGRYHVLHGVISPMNHVGPDDLAIKPLVERVAKGGVEEVIMATNPDTEGEATAMYIARLLKPFGVRVTRLAYGIPVGGHLEFADDATLMRALEGRRDIWSTNGINEKSADQMTVRRPCFQLTGDPARQKEKTRGPPGVLSRFFITGSEKPCQRVLENAFDRPGAPPYSAKTSASSAPWLCRRRLQPAVVDHQGVGGRCPAPRRTSGEEAQPHPQAPPAAAGPSSDRPVSSRSRKCSPPLFEMAMRWAKGLARKVASTCAAAQAVLLRIRARWRS